MIVRGVVDEDIVNYKVPCMFIITAFCDWKCEMESGVRCCQNSALAQQKAVDVSVESLIERYLRNSITKALCFGGLEPFQQFDDVLDVISRLRCNYHCDDTVVIYTGYDMDEVLPQLELLKRYRNIVVKFGRFLPDHAGRYDDVLGVKLASHNQYAVQLS